MLHTPIVRRCLGVISPDCKVEDRELDDDVAHKLVMEGPECYGIGFSSWRVDEPEFDTSLSVQVSGDVAAALAAGTTTDLMACGIEGPPAVVDKAAKHHGVQTRACLLYTSDAADE